MNKEEIIVVEDNDTMRIGIAESLKRDGYHITAFDNGIDALKKFSFRQSQIAIVDLKMEPIDGIEILKQIKDINPATEVLMISAFGTVDDAVKAMHLGAGDFLSKPFSPDELRIRVKKLADKRQKAREMELLLEQNRMLNDDLLTNHGETVMASPAIKSVYALVEQVAAKDSTVLIHGESGTGKEVIAKDIHKKSSRSQKPFIRVNCGALNENLLESELFGHEKGSFTGAIKQKKGRFELADNGTLFLDEIGDITPAMQVKLLRVLQEGEFERVGGEETIRTNVRIIAATNKNLQKLISVGKFREDLFYRLSVIPLTLPSLRERKEDILPLVNHFLRNLAARHKQEKHIDDEGMKLFLNYSWPGNIRELENLIERLYVISPGNEISPALIAAHLNNTIPHTNNYNELPLEEAVYSFEKNLVIQAMKKADGVKNRAAKILGISTSVLYYKLEKFKLL
jgi:DNA-binding NtrC family response regulator